MLLGVDLGVGLETKLTILALCVGIVVAVVVVARPSAVPAYPIPVDRNGHRDRTRVAQCRVADRQQLPHAHVRPQSQRGHLAERRDRDVRRGFRALPRAIRSAGFDGGVVFLLRDHRLRPMGVLTLPTSRSCCRRARRITRHRPSCSGSRPDAWPSAGSRPSGGGEWPPVGSSWAPSCRSLCCSPSSCRSSRSRRCTPPDLTRCARLRRHRGLAAAERAGRRRVRRTARRRNRRARRSSRGTTGRPARSTSTACAAACRRR